MHKIEIYTKAWCGYCHMARSLLQSLGCQFREYNVSADFALQQEMMQRTGGWTVPQVLIDDQPVGGFMELSRLQHSGALARMLADPDKPT